MLGAQCLTTWLRGPRDDSEEQQTEAAVGALLVFEGLWHLRALHGTDLQMKIVKGPSNG